MVTVLCSLDAEVAGDLLAEGAVLCSLNPGANVVAVGPIGPGGVLTGSTVTEPAVVEIVLARGPAKLWPSGCSASAITTAAILAGGLGREHGRPRAVLAGAG